MSFNWNNVMPSKSEVIMTMGDLIADNQKSVTVGLREPLLMRDARRLAVDHECKRDQH